jgi:hypothetical protein
MKSAWGSKIYDAAAWNSSQADSETCILDFEQLLIEDGDLVEWEKELASSHLDKDDVEMVI